MSGIWGIFFLVTFMVMVSFCAGLLSDWHVQKPARDKAEKKKADALAAEAKNAERILELRTQAVNNLHISACEIWMQVRNFKPSDNLGSSKAKEFLKSYEKLINLVRLEH